MAEPTTTNDESRFAELDALVDRYFDGVASDADVQRLEAMLIGDEAAALRASERSLVHRQISELLAEEQLHDIMSRYAVGLNGLPRPMANSKAGMQDSDDSGEANNTAPASRNRPQTVSTRLGRGFVTAAIAASLLGLAFWPRGDQPGLILQPTDGVASRDPGAAATITQLADVRWTKAAVRYDLGESLLDGSRVQLDRGLAKITFDCGAEVMLEGPCDFTVRDKMVGVLRRGTLAANVPRRAFAFAILSPKADFVDLGTSFGVTVDDGGESELHVFEGEVLYSAPGGDAPADNDAVHVRADEAVKFGSAGGSEGIAVNSAPFSPLMNLRRQQLAGELPLSGADLALWLKADDGVAVDDRGRVVGWHDLLYGDNRAAEDATQFDEAARPALASRAINGRPAIRFDGTSDFLLTTPLETTDNQTVLLVCQYSEAAFDSSRQWGGQILNYDGPPGREASNTFSPGILQIGEPLLEQDFQPSLVSSQVFAGFIGSAVVETGRIDAAPLGPGRPAIVAYRYDFTAGKADLAVDGHPFGQARAFAPQALTSRKIIGRHAWKELFFHGDLAELLIFNRALSDEDLAAATGYLSRKYDIPLDGTAD